MLYKALNFLELLQWLSEEAPVNMSGGLTAMWPFCHLRVCHVINCVVPWGLNSIPLMCFANGYLTSPVCGSLRACQCLFKSSVFYLSWVNSASSLWNGCLVAKVSQLCHCCILKQVVFCFARLVCVGMFGSILCLFPLYAVIPLPTPQPLCLPHSSQEQPSIFQNSIKDIPGNKCFLIDNYYCWLSYAWYNLYVRRKQVSGSWTYL